MPPKKVAAAKAISKKDAAVEKAPPKTSTNKSAPAKAPTTETANTKKAVIEASAAKTSAVKAPAAKKATAPTTKAAKSAAASEKPARGRPKKSASKLANGIEEKKAAGTIAQKGTKRKGTSEPPAPEHEEAKPAAAKQRKRKTTEEPAPRPVKKARTIPHVAINKAPTQRLHVYVCGEGSSGELGLGTAKNAVDVKRPRLNPFLPADTVGVVQIAVGGMHAAALTQDNKILTWGVNDQGALGRDTAWEGGLKDMDDANKSDDSSSDSGNDSGLNPRESTPTAIPNDAFPEGTKIVEVAAGDSTTFALTDDGFVYGWGTFRSNEGILGFTEKIHVQPVPLLIPEVKKIVHIETGANHVLALTEKGAVFAWGSGQQNQLGRRVVERTRMNGLVPREFGLPRNKVALVGCGSYHSFAMDKTGKVWAWGLNNFGETGVNDGAGEDGAVVLAPTVVKSLSKHEIVQIKGGSHHSIAVTKEGECLVWGRVDGFQMGIKQDGLPKEDVIYDEKMNPRILKTPTSVPGLAVKFATAGSDTSIAITTEGQVYSWGFSANYQTGQGTDDDVEVATLIDNTAVRGKKLNWAGAGGQFSIFTAPAEGDKSLVNGV
ncbi:MAG: Regulator of chromosome condensation [Pycnora praestabilis]|nr:MAG: Regulator of chromosome condensation [Pycnora praestabilis]